MLKTRWVVSAAIVALFGLAAVVVSVGFQPDQEPAIVINPTATPESLAPNLPFGAVRPTPTAPNVATFGGALDSPAEPVPIQPTPTPTPTALATEVPTETPTSTPFPGSGPTLEDLTVALVPEDLPVYNRREWRHWIDADGDCQDARQEVLIEESVGLIVFTDAKQCRLESGKWLTPFTGTTVTDPGKLDIDHLVPLANAHRSGGHAWDADRKKAYANDLSNPAHLVAVTGSANRSKRARGPEDWRPPNEGAWCQYGQDWTGVKVEWELTVTRAEVEALGEMLGTCG